VGAKGGSEMAGGGGCRVVVEGSGEERGRIREVEGGRVKGVRGRIGERIGGEGEERGRGERGRARGREGKGIRGWGMGGGVGGRGWGRGGTGVVGRGRI